MTTTESPLNDPKVREEVLDVTKNEYSKEIVKEATKINIKDLDYEEQDYLVEIAESKQSLNFDIFTKNLIDTEHLDNYEAFEYDLGLDGDSYIPFKKALWYYENSLKQPTISYKINNRTNIDNRKHLLAIAPASAGKSTAKNQIKRIIDKNSIIEVAGFSHPEQLVGKTKYKGRGDKKEAIPVPGVMSYKGVLYDEAQELLNEKNDIYAKCQRIKRIAMDTYGENKLSKKLVDDSKEDAETFGYYPECRLFDLAHPKKLESPFFDTGSFRRYDIFNLSYDSVINLNDITDFKFSDEKIDVRYPEVLDKHYSNPRVDVQFSEQTLKIISHFHKCLLYYLLNHKNQNAFRYGLLTRYSLRNVFAKNVLVLALCKNEQTPSPQTTIKACGDTLLFIFKTIETINELGDMGVAKDVWGGCNENDAQALEYLLRVGALDRDSSYVSVKKFQTILAQFYGCRITQARAHFYRLKRGGFIDSQQVGQYDSCVWLKFVPKGVKLDAQGFDPLTIPQDIVQGVGLKNSDLTPSIREFIDDKTIKILQGDKGVGVMGCVLALYMCSSSSKINKNLYIEKGYPDTPTPPTPSPQNTILSTIKEESQGDKTPKTEPTPSSSPDSPKSMIGQVGQLDNHESDRDVQYWDAKETQSIVPCDKEKVLEHLKQNPNTPINELLEKFGAGIMKLKKEGLIK